MHPIHVRTRAITAAALLILAAACNQNSDAVGASKLGGIKEGMPMSAVLPMLGTGPLAPLNAPDVQRLTNGFRTSKYFVNGNNYAVLFYREAPGTLEDPISRTTSTPILFRNDSVVGWGWSTFEEKTAEFGIPNPERDQARLDSISKSQMANAPKP